MIHDACPSGHPGGVVLSRAVLVKFTRSNFFQNRFSCDFNVNFQGRPVQNAGIRKAGTRYLKPALFKTKAFHMGWYRSVNMVVYYCRYRYFRFSTADWFNFVQISTLEDVVARRDRRSHYRFFSTTTTVVVPWYYSSRILLGILLVIKNLCLSY